METSLILSEIIFLCSGLEFGRTSEAVFIQLLEVRLNYKPENRELSLRQNSYEFSFVWWFYTRNSLTQPFK